MAPYKSSAPLRPGHLRWDDNPDRPFKVEDGTSRFVRFHGSGEYRFDATYTARRDAAAPCTHKTTAFIETIDATATLTPAEKQRAWASARYSSAPNPSGPPRSQRWAGAVPQEVLVGSEDERCLHGPAGRPPPLPVGDGHLEQPLGERPR